MDYELDEMRQRMAILKDKLEKQTIVDDRIIRRAISNGASTINKRYLVISIIALAMIPYGYWAFVMLNGLSVALWIACSVMMLMVVAFCYFNGRALRDRCWPRATCTTPCGAWQPPSGATLAGNG